MKQIVIGVHTLLDLIFRQSDLVLALPSSKRLEEGIMGHKEVQLSRPEEYEAEVSFEFPCNYSSCDVLIRGRIDGIYSYESLLKIEEIKTTYLDLEGLSLESHPYYAAQLKLYMYFLSRLYPEKEIRGVLTYFSLKNSQTKEIELKFKKEEFEEFFISLIKELVELEKREDEWREKRDLSIKDLAFPFKDLRKGQDELMRQVFSVIEKGEHLMIEAPTGIGKTSAIIFPALKNLSSGLYDSIFFLTAKTPGQNIVRETLEIFKEGGLSLRSVFLNAKEKMCFKDECLCDPSFCEYAKGYYDKLPLAVDEILDKEIFTREKILEICKIHKVCPFEFSLDLSLYCDFIICDYNYLFDPNVFLRRYFTSGNRKYLFLIDEAHNLVSRGRDMYSASISKRIVLDLKREMKDKNPGLFEIFDGMNRLFIQWNKDLKENNRGLLLLENIPGDYDRWKEEFFEFAEEHFRKELSSGLKDFYYEFRYFTKIMKLLSPDFRLFVKREGKTLLWKILCLNPGKELSKRLKKARSAIFFSATLSPPEYFRELLCPGEEPEFLSLPSPFPPENVIYLHIPGISTTYKKREYYHHIIADHIKKILALKPGNYLAFFPSYKYLQDVYEKIDCNETIEVYVQERAMSESDREKFLELFTPSEKTRLGMAVMGGLFGEAVDLPGERLVGAIITGVGLPMVDEEQELIFDYFEKEEEGKGFLYTYMIPGMIRVIQSAGRVLRTPEDKGIIVLIGDRFRYSNYRKLLPRRWLTTKRAFSAKLYERILREFWYGK